MAHSGIFAVPLGNVLKFKVPVQSVDVDGVITTTIKSTSSVDTDTDIFATVSFDCLNPSQGYNVQPAIWAGLSAAIDEVLNNLANSVCDPESISVQQNWTSIVNS